MKVLHLNAGNETGGGMVHILSLLNELKSENIYLGLFEEGTFQQEAMKRMASKPLLLRKKIDMIYPLFLMSFSLLKIIKLI